MSELELVHRETVQEAAKRWKEFALQPNGEWKKLRFPFPVQGYADTEDLYKKVLECSNADEVDYVLDPFCLGPYTMIKCSCCGKDTDIAVSFVVDAEDAFLCKSCAEKAVQAMNGGG